MEAETNFFFPFFWPLVAGLTIICAILSTAWFFPDRRWAKDEYTAACVLILAEHAFFLWAGGPQSWLLMVTGGGDGSSWQLLLILPLTVLVFCMPLLRSRLSEVWGGGGIWLIRIALIVLFNAALFSLLGYRALLIGLLLALFLYYGERRPPRD